jgi:hypothetical protein
MQTSASPVRDEHLIQARAIVALEKEGWSRMEILRLFHITERTYFRRMRLVRQVEKGKAG